jgi:hypothetical protein
LDHEARAGSAEPAESGDDAIEVGAKGFERLGCRVGVLG